MCVAGEENEHWYLKERQRRSQGKETERMAGEGGGKPKECGHQGCQEKSELRAGSVYHCHGQ